MKAAILGTVTVSKMLAPFDDLEWEIWACSPGNRRAFPRVTRWFELHAVMDVKRPENNDWNGDYFGWLQTQQFPVYMQEPNELVPGCRIFPRDAWLREFGDRGREAATSSIALMIGFAIMEGATEIGVFGVDMSADHEHYTNQKPGCRQMLLIARERGIKVCVPLESCLATPPPFYGYAEATRLGMKMYIREKEHEVQIAQARAEVSRLSAQINHLEGALESIRYIRRTFVDGVDDAEIDDQPQQVEGVAAGTYKVHFDDHRPVAVPASEPTIVDVLKRPEDVETDKTAGGVLVPRRHARGNSAGQTAE
jgi:hypothetical protein